MLSKIENIICLGEGVTPEEIHVKSREGGVKETRQLIMYFAKEMNPNMTWKKIAGYFNLDHATGTHAKKTIENLIATNKTFSEKIKKHRNRLKAIKIDKMVDHASDVFKPLEFEVLKLEKKLTDLRKLITEIKTELGEINCHSFESVDEIKFPLIDVKNTPKVTAIDPLRNSRPVNNNPQAGAYHGYIQHAI